MAKHIPNIGKDDDSLINDDWFEVNETDWLPPLMRAKKLRLYADASIPVPIIREL